MRLLVASQNVEIRLHNLSIELDDRKTTAEKIRAKKLSADSSTSNKYLQWGFVIATLTARVLGEIFAERNYSRVVSESVEQHVIRTWVGDIKIFWYNQILLAGFRSVIVIVLSVALFKLFYTKSV